MPAAVKTKSKQAKPVKRAEPKTKRLNKAQEPGDLPWSKPEARAADLPAAVKQVPLSSITENPWQPRRTLDPKHVTELAESIAQVGLLQRPLARYFQATDTYQLAFGHARVAAVRELGWETVTLDVRELSDTDMALLALTENAKRKDVSPLETYRAWDKALRELPGLTIEALAGTLGLERSTVANDLRILALPAVVLDRVDRGELSAHAAREFLSLLSLGDGKPGKDNGAHAHVDLMANVLKAIFNQPVGRPVDNRVANVRKVIFDQVTASRVTEWRRVGSNPATGFYGGSHAMGPVFDVKAFERDYAEVIHRIPVNDDNGRDKGSVSFTCDVKAWAFHNNAAKAEAGPAVGAEKASKDPNKADAARAFAQTLKRDPLVRKTLGADQADKSKKGEKPVSEETAVKAAAKEVGPVGPELKADDDQASDKVKAYRLVNQFMEDYAKAHPTLEALAELPDELCEYATTHDINGKEFPEDENADPEDVRAIQSIIAGSGGSVRNLGKAYVNQVGRKVDAQLTGGVNLNSLTKEQKAALGSRLEPFDPNKAKGWKQRITPGEYNSAPVYLDNIKECETSCTIGARYSVPERYGDNRSYLWCTNQEHYEGKLATGLAKFKDKLAVQQDKDNEADQVAVQEILPHFPDHDGAYLTLVTLLAGGGEYRRYEPVGGQNGRSNQRDQADLSYDPGTMVRLGELLGVKVPAGQWHSLSAEAALKALPKASNHTVLEALGNLLVWQGHQYKYDPLALLGKKGGVPNGVKAKTEKPSKPGKQRGGDKEVTNEPEEALDSILVEELLRQTLISFPPPNVTSAQEGT